MSYGGLSLDLLLKFGVLVRKVLDGTIKLADDYEAKICYIVGDVKTVDNMDKIFRDLADRTLTAEETFDLAEVFEKALKRLIIIPGDWHAGLTMVQSIFNIFWDSFLEPIKTTLGWQRVNKDARGCYFQASRLINFVHTELITVLMESFIGKTHLSLMDKFMVQEETDQSEANYVCFIAKQFSLYITQLSDCDDDWLRTCSMFITMSQDFFAFVASYRNGDSIGIESGYQTFVGVWKALGQKRYEERHWRQQEMLLEKITYRELEQFRRNRTGRSIMILLVNQSSPLTSVLSLPIDISLNFQEQDHLMDLLNKATMLVCLLCASGLYKWFIPCQRMTEKTLSIVLVCRQDVLPNEQEFGRSSTW